MTMRQQGPGSGTVVLTWAFVVERVTGIEPALSAWEATGALWRASSICGYEHDI
jgi:hypothetical protein